METLLEADSTEDILKPTKRRQKVKYVSTYKDYIKLSNALVVIEDLLSSTGKGGSINISRKDVNDKILKPVYKIYNTGTTQKTRTIKKGESYFEKEREVKKPFKDIYREILKYYEAPEDIHYDEKKGVSTLIGASKLIRRYILLFGLKERTKKIKSDDFLEYTIGDLLETLYAKNKERLFLERQVQFLAQNILY